MTTALDFRVAQVINSIDAEFRRPVIDALQASDGTVTGFATELCAQTWDSPMLPVDDILARICYDVV